MYACLILGVLAGISMTTIFQFALKQMKPHSKEQLTAFFGTLAAVLLIGVGIGLVTMTGSAGASYAQTMQNVMLYSLGWMCTTLFGFAWKAWR